MGGEVSHVRLVDRLEEECGIEEMRIDLARPRLALDLGPGMHRDLLPHLADAGKIGWETGGVALEDGIGRRAVETRIDADSAEERKAAVLGEHRRGGALAAIVLVIDQSLPSGIGPRRSAEPDERRYARSESLEFLPGHQCRRPASLLHDAVD